ncbi:hypothetical protein QBC39DRAFT_33810 [Podospora conica]|nr:hypothetical protein QBC39DRAFT_33810 [Schizothecium conicum]
MTNILLLLGAFAARASAQACDYYDNNQCIKPEVTASVTIPFAPLLPTPPTFVYAIDELDDNDIKTQEEKDEFSIPSRLSYTGAILKTAWWLQYDNATINLDGSQNRQYYAFAMETNSTNPIGGASNGCESLLGSECIRNLKDVIAAKTFGASIILGGLGTRLVDLTNRPLRNLSCPDDIFGVKPDTRRLTEYQMPMLLPRFGKFAEIVDYKRNEGPLPPGNSSLTHSVAELRYRSMEQQREQGIVAVTVSWPALETNERNYSMRDVTVEMACLRVGGAGTGGAGSANGGSGGAGGGGGVNGGDGENMASVSRVSGGAVVAVGAAMVLSALL